MTAVAPPVRTLAAARWEALGTGVVVLTADPSALDAAAATVGGTVAALDVAASRFRPDSDLSAANRAAGHWVEVGDVLLDAVEAALAAADATGGAVDPTLGRSIVALGWDGDWRQLALDGPPVRATGRPVPAWRDVRLDRRRHRIRVPAGAALDLGATAKAWGADRAAAAAVAATGTGVLVSLGGDLAMAGPAPAGGWPVRIAEDHAAPPGPGDAHVVAWGGGLATSSTTVRRWSRGGEAFHHLLDPITGRPAGGPWRTATVAAATCAQANTASTAAIVIGDRAVDWLEDHGLPARLISTAGDVTTTRMWQQA